MVPGPSVFLTVAKRSPDRNTATVPPALPSLSPFALPEWGRDSVRVSARGGTVPGAAPFRRADTRFFNQVGLCVDGPYACDSLCP